MNKYIVGLTYFYGSNTSGETKSKEFDSLDEAKKYADDNWSQGTQHSDGGYYREGWVTTFRRHYTVEADGRYKYVGQF